MNLYLFSYRLGLYQQVVRGKFCFSNISKFQIYLSTALQIFEDSLSTFAGILPKIPEVRNLFLYI